MFFFSEAGHGMSHQKELMNNQGLELSSSKTQTLCSYGPGLNTRSKLLLQEPYPFRCFNRYQEPGGR